MLKMFNKVKNIDLLNKITAIENKLDILSTGLNNTISNIPGCCDCQNREMTIYKEIKDYLENKITEFNIQIEELNKNNQINEKIINTNNMLIVEFNKMFQDYRNEVIDNLQKIIDNLYNYNKANTSLSNNRYMQQMDIISRINDLEKDIDNKISDLYFDNQIIKHQLLLEEEIRQCNDEITNLSLIIEKTISELA
jgi:hypothetical protein